ncbi:MAG: hypothetical protein ACHQ01_04630 [Candidatus Limnocylindrales bacterium]
MNAEFLTRVDELAADATKGPTLHDVIGAEARRVVEAMRDESFAAKGVAFSNEELVRRVAACEGLVDDLSRAAAVIGYWSESADPRLLPWLVRRLANAVERGEGLLSWLGLVRYPALLVTYAGGLGAVIGGQEGLLGPMLTRPIIWENDGWKPAATHLSSATVLSDDLAKRLPGLERRTTPMSDHLVEITRPWLEDLEPDQIAFERAFDRYEFLAGLLMFDLTRGDNERGWGPIGRFHWRSRYVGGVSEEIGAELSANSVDWPLVRAGAFRGSGERAAESFHGYLAHLRQIYI